MPRPRSQLAAKDYGAELRTGGATEVFAFAVAFDGKVVRVRGAWSAPTQG